MICLRCPGPSQEPLRPRLRLGAVGWLQEPGHQPAGGDRGDAGAWGRDARLRGAAPSGPDGGYQGDAHTYTRIHHKLERAGSHTFVHA